MTTHINNFKGLKQLLARLRKIIDDDEAIGSLIE